LLTWEEYCCSERKLADFVVLSDNPLKIHPRKIADIKVFETIKEGQSVYRRKSAD
jgi:hypothetical protein